MFFGIFSLIFIFWLIYCIIKGVGTNGGRTIISNSRISLLDQLMVIVAAVMKANKVAKKSELQVVKNFLSSNFSEQDIQIALEKLRNNLKTQIYTYQVTQSCRLILNHTNYTTRIAIMNLLFQISAADGEIDIYEYELLKNIRINLDIYINDFDNLKRNFNLKSARDFNYSRNHYTVLGLTSNATEQEIKKAFREKAKLYHPDKYSNSSEKELQKAKEMFQEINYAYEEICKERNIK